MTQAPSYHEVSRIVPGIALFGGSIDQNTIG